MVENKIIFKQAPLPFVGQKRMFLKHIEKVLNENIVGDGEGWIIIDVFGGSGLLSHIAKCLKPKAQVIYNDFDDYAQRVKHIDDINALRAEIYAVIKDIPEEKRIPQALKEKIIHIIQHFEGYKDLRCLTSWLLFSGQQIKTLEELFNKEFWNKIRKSDYPKAEGYLDGVEIVKQSFCDLIPQFGNNKKALLLLDPPYICTRQESYKKHFNLIDFLKLANSIRPPYIFFSSTKSEFLKFIEFTQESKTNNYLAFENAMKIELKTSTGYSGKYTDNMVYKF